MRCQLSKKTQTKKELTPACLKTAKLRQPVTTIKTIKKTRVVRTTEPLMKLTWDLSTKESKGNPRRTL